MKNRWTCSSIESSDFRCQIQHPIRLKNCLASLGTPPPDLNLSQAYESGIFKLNGGWVPTVRGWLTGKGIVATDEPTGSRAQSANQEFGHGGAVEMSDAQGTSDTPLSDSPAVMARRWRRARICERGWKTEKLWISQRESI
jgi:hypothetical protein